MGKEYISKFDDITEVAGIGNYIEKDDLTKGLYWSRTGSAGSLVYRATRLGQSSSPVIVAISTEVPPIENHTVGLRKYAHINYVGLLSVQLLLNVNSTDRTKYVDIKIEAAMPTKTVNAGLRLNHLQNTLQYMNASGGWTNWDQLDTIVQNPVIIQYSIEVNLLLAKYGKCRISGHDLTMEGLSCQLTQASTGNRITVTVLGTQAASSYPVQLNIGGITISQTGA